MDKKLEPKHVKEVMETDVKIGVSSTRFGNAKIFAYNPQAGEFRVYYNGKYREGGQDLEALLELYNELE